jgi:excinuclease UvrABC nuclease subunit
MGYTERREKGDYRWVPYTSGIYRLYHGDQVVYVGQTNNLRGRLEEHERIRSHWGSYDYKSTRYVNTRDRKRMEERAITYNRPTRNRR